MGKIKGVTFKTRTLENGKVIGPEYVMEKTGVTYKVALKRMNEPEKIMLAKKGERVGHSYAFVPKEEEPKFATKEIEIAYKAAMKKMGMSYL